MVWLCGALIFLPLSCDDDVLFTHEDVVFGIDNLGKEELLARLAAEFNTMCVVSPDRLRWIHMCDLPDAQLFTDIANAGRFSVEPRRSVTKERFVLVRFDGSG